MQPQADQAPSLADTLALLRRRKLVIILTAAVVVISALAWSQIMASRADPEYRASHRLAANMDRGIGLGELERTAILVRDGAIGKAAREALDGHSGAIVTAAADPELGLLTISAVSADPDRATEVADEYAQELLKALADEDRRRYEVQVADQSKALREATEALEAANFLYNIEPEDARLQAERDSAITRYQASLDALRSIESAGVPEPAFETLTTAEARLLPLGGFAGLPLFRQLLVAGILGALLGVGAAYAREAIDRRLSTAAAATESFGVPVLAEVPDGGKTFARAPHLAPPGSVITEAYRRLRTIVQLEREAGGAPDAATVILVTSPSPSEGKSTTVAHLARALGEVGSRVLMVSGDFRRPTLHAFFGVEAKAGIAAVHAGANGRTASELIQETEIPRVSLVTAGSGSHDPTKLIANAQLLIREARNYYDYVIIDTSPLLSANDALDFVNQVDMVIAVAKYRSTTRPQAERFQEMLVRTGAPLIGVVLTSVKDGEGYGYYYGYYAPTSASKSPSESKASRL